MDRGAWQATVHRLQRVRHDELRMDGLAENRTDLPRDEVEKRVTSCIVPRSI